MAKKKKARKKAARKKKGAKKKGVKRKAPKKKGGTKRAKKKAGKKKAKKKAAKKKAAKKKAPKKKAKKKRKPNPAFMRPLEASAELQAIIGRIPLPRSGVVKKLWSYIRKNGLQDAINRRMINADEKLRAVFRGKKQVSMFEMNKLISKHLK